MVIAYALEVGAWSVLTRFLCSQGKGWVASALGLTGPSPRGRGVSSAQALALVRDGLLGSTLGTCLKPVSYDGEGYKVTTFQWQGHLLVVLTDSLGAAIDANVTLRQDGSVVEPDEDLQEQEASLFRDIPAGPVTLLIEHPPRITREIDIMVPDVEMSPELRRYIDGGARVFFMPIVSLCEGKIIGYEALARGSESDRFPVELFAEAESTGRDAIVKLDLACAQSALQLAAGAEWAEARSIFVNVSHETICHSEFRDLCMSQSPVLPPSQVVFEIKEHVPEALIDSLQTHILPLFLKGYRFAIDDQGAQGTCGRVLLNARTAYVKADVKFVNDCLRFGMYDVLRGYLMAAAGVGGRVIAEGVEEDWGVRDMGRFFELGVPYVQGFMFGKAMPPEAVHSEIPHESRRLLEQVWNAYEFAGELTSAMVQHV